jgi:hypothetical protein
VKNINKMTINTTATKQADAQMAKNLGMNATMNNHRLCRVLIPTISNG